MKTRRFESLSVQDISQYLAVALLAGCFYWQAGRGQMIGDAQQTIGLLFFGLLFLVRPLRPTRCPLPRLLSALNSLSLLSHSL